MCAGRGRGCEIFFLIFFFFFQDQEKQEMKRFDHGVAKMCSHKNEDRFCIQTSLNGDETVDYYGVFDGHAGLFCFVFYFSPFSIFSYPFPQVATFPSFVPQNYTNISHR